MNVRWGFQTPEFSPWATEWVWVPLIGMDGGTESVPGSCTSNTGRDVAVKKRG